MTFFSLNTYVPLSQEVYYLLSYPVIPIHEVSEKKKKNQEKENLIKSILLP